MIRDQWWDLFEVRMAERMSGGDPAAFLEALITIADSGIVRNLRNELASRGLTIDDIMDMRSAVMAAEYNAGEGKAQGQELRTETTRDAVRRLFLARFDERQISEILGLEVEKVSSYLRKLGSNAQEVTRLHHAGKTPVEIAERVGITPNGVYYILAQAGLEPHRKLRRLTSEQKEKILKLRAQGKTQGEIAEVLGITIYDVKNTVRLARKRGAA